MNCDEAQAQFLELLDGTGGMQAARHVEQCAACAREFERYRHTVDLVRALRLVH